MPRVAMTDRFVAAARPAGTERIDYFDTVTRGLVLRVGPGSKSWQFFYTSPSDGKRARSKLGTYPATSLATARGLVIEAAGAVERREDPRRVKAQQAIEMTMADLIKAYLADPAQLALDSAAEKARRFQRNVLPKIGRVPLRELRRRDVRNATDPILARGAPVEAARCFEDIRAALRWGLQHEYLAANPIDGMAKPGGGKPRERVLTDDEVATLWNGLGQALRRSKQCQQILKLCLATAQRVGEVSGMRIGELDLDARLWRLPGERTKNGHSHIVPLSELAISILTEVRAELEEGSRFLFPCGEGVSLPPAAVARTIVRAHETTETHPAGRFGIPQWSAHDLRRTALTGMARLGISPHIIAAVANHRSVTKASVTSAVYVRYSYENEMRSALDVWGNRLSSIVDTTYS